MKTRIQKNKIYVVILLLVGFISCDSKGVFDNYKSIPNNLWNQKESVRFEFSIADTISKNNVFINLRNNNDYKYSNLYLVAQLNFPDGKQIIDTLQYEMADNTGKFLGVGVSEIKESKLFYKENVQFWMSGVFSVEVFQAMRENGAADGIEMLDGITDVGLRIEKIE